ncbi:uncharacterized protein F4822DRAFT_385351 [Hypoxylon trugodes]|uniref:uncharacterized protein n=1 Tax=Hypoxylon trugodes TaxID=326681 RepID=UPI0021909D3E|nr:uncharacterized protein F4822DRAFT_385351 [Hypoxylon trugodes]KAI1393643.1 hypothetical protein F4822DRAFT_385351 [Hypoxylon trugodes]
MSNTALAACILHFPLCISAFCRYFGAIPYSGFVTLFPVPSQVSTSKFLAIPSLDELTYASLSSHRLTASASNCQSDAPTRLNSWA